MAIQSMPDSNQGKSKSRRSTEGLLPMPSVPEATNGVIDLVELAGDATVKVSPWSMIEPGQTVWLTVTGPGGVPTLRLLEAYPLSAAQVNTGIRETVARAELEKITVGGKVTVQFKVGFRGESDEEVAVVFPEASYEIAKSLLEDFESASDGGVPPGGKRYLPSMVMTCKAGSVDIRTDDDPYFAPYITRRYVALDRNASLSMELNAPAKSFTFGVSTSWASPLNVSAYDAGGDLLFSLVVPTPETGEESWATFTSATRNIKMIVLFSPYMVTYIDNFKLV